MRVSPFFVFKNLGKIVSVSDPFVFFCAKDREGKKKVRAGHRALGAGLKQRHFRRDSGGKSPELS